MKHLAILMTCIVAAQASKAGELSIKAVDEHGHAIPGFEVMALGIHTNFSWIRSRKGIATIDPIPQGSITVVVRCDGFATAVKQLPFETSQQPNPIVTVELEQGSEVTLQLRDERTRSLPHDFVPDVFFDGYQSDVARAWQGTGEFRDFNMLNAKVIGRNRYSIRLPSSSRTFVVGIHVPGVLRGFVSEPLGSADVKHDHYNVELPRPATVSLNYSPGETQPDEAPKSAEATIRVQGENGAFCKIIENIRAGETIHIDDLAPGSCKVTLEAGFRSFETRKLNPRQFWDRRYLNLHAGQVSKADCVFVPFDPLAYKGDRQVNITVLDQEDRPASGHRAQVLYFDGHYGYLEVFAGFVPDNGVLRIENVTARMPAGELDPYVIAIDGKRQDSFRVQDLDEIQNLEVRIVPIAGDRAPSIRLLSLDAQGDKSLEDFHGQIVILELWSTWCGPCQPAMDELNAIAGRSVEAWNGKVVVAGLNIHDDAAAARKHVARRGWTHIQNYGTGGKSDGALITTAQRALGVSGVPTTFVIDPTGTIAWRGNPHDVDIQQLVDSLLAK